ncbi:MAG: hypothetical protein J6O49_12705, partial [Bacteroidaceae bacterium]|nr:hypothetical protein [Bacteroidaceae bacterium]
MKKVISLVLFMIFPSVIMWAQKKDFSYRFYGQVRNDIYFNSRQNNESVDGALLSYPKGKDIDPAGKDINAVSNLNLYNMHTRLGIDVNGPDLAGWKTSAKVEFDF